MIQQRILILEERDTDAGIAYLSEGPGAPAITLIISWPTVEEARVGMERISQCGCWRVIADECILTVIGHGEVLLNTGEMAVAIFSSTWMLDDPYAVSFFVAQARTQGYFLLLPAINKMPGVDDPMPCYLG